MGVIAIDSIFTPIKNVRYFVETTRVGQQTDYEKLTLEIETDGSITPDDALAYAGKILRDHIQLFINFDLEPDGDAEDIGPGCGVRPCPQGAPYPGGGAGTLRPLAQLSPGGEHQDHRRPRAPRRVRAAEVPQLRTQKSLAELSEIIEAEKLPSEWM